MAATEIAAYVTYSTNDDNINRDASHVKKSFFKQLNRDVRRPPFITHSHAIAEGQKCRQQVYITRRHVTVTTAE